MPERTMSSLFHWFDESADANAPLTTPSPKRHWANQLDIDAAELEIHRPRPRSFVSYEKMAFDFHCDHLLRKE